MQPITPTHQTCPYCHTPVAWSRYERAGDGVHTWRICPECDHAMLTTGEREGELLTKRNELHTQPAPIQAPSGTA